METCPEVADAFEGGTVKCAVAALFHRLRYSGRLAVLRRELLGGGQLSVRLAHACVRLPYGVGVVGVAGECSDDICELSASHLGGLVFQDKTCYVGSLYP